MQLQFLGVFETIYGADAEMTLSRALIISLIGFIVVFIILGILAIFVKAMGGIFDKINESKKNVPANASAVTANPAVSKGSPLPDNTSAGSLKLVDVSEQDAAVIMALVSHKSGIPLNRLQFNSIKLTEEDKK